MISAVSPGQPRVQQQRLSEFISTRAAEAFARAQAEQEQALAAPITHNVPHCRIAEWQPTLVNRHSPGQEIRAYFCHILLLSHVLPASYFLHT